MALGANRRSLPLVALVVAAVALGSLLGCVSDPEENRPLAFSPAELPEGTRGEPYRAEIGVVNADSPVIGVRLVSGVLPTGLELQPTERGGGRLAGTPAQAGTFPLTFAASCYGTQTTGQYGQKSYELVIREPD